MEVENMKQNWYEKHSFQDSFFFPQHFQFLAWAYILTLYGMPPCTAEWAILSWLWDDVLLVNLGCVYYVFCVSHNNLTRSQYTK